MEGWTFLYMFVILKIPVIAALWLVWWAVHGEPAEAERQPDESGGGGGSPHPRRPRSRPPRRGSHAEPVSRPPKRIRARGRQLAPTGRR